LSPCGCEIHEAAEGREGIEKILSVKPDVIILDVRIPVVQGYEVCRYIKRHPETSGAKVLMISGLMNASDREWAKSCGADATMQKPFDRDELVNKVTQLVTGEN
jgi:twitching motility two-component system response regulator PilH